MSETISFRADGALEAALNAAANRAGTSISDVVRAGLERAYTRPRPNYGIGAPCSFVADARAVLTRAGDTHDAEIRLRDFRERLTTGAAFVDFALSTATVSQVAEPQYSPLVPDQVNDRPLRNLATVLPLAAPTPFTLPGEVSATGATSPHVEGTNPSAGTLAFSGETISPAGVSGRFEITRELADAANPAVDALALVAMVEDYNLRCEAAVAAELAAQTGADTTTSSTIAADLKEWIARMPARRRRRATAAVATGADTYAAALSAALDETTGDRTATWRVEGVPVNLSPDLPAAQAGDVAAVITSPSSLWAWESGPTTFRYEDRNGPALIELALWGYFCARVVRPSGVAVLKVASE